MPITVPVQHDVRACAIVIACGKTLVSFGLIGASIYLLDTGVDLLKLNPTGGIEQSSLFEWGSMRITASGFGAVVLMASIIPMFFAYLSRPQLKQIPLPRTDGGSSGRDDLGNGNSNRRELDGGNSNRGDSANEKNEPSTIDSDNSRIEGTGPNPKQAEKRGAQLDLISYGKVS